MLRVHFAMVSAAPQPARAAAHADIARQHHALDVEVGELRTLIDSCPAPQRTERYRLMLSVLVGRLAERLKTHFQVEAEEGYLFDITAARPDLGEVVGRLHAQHAAMIRDATTLAELLRAPLAPPDAVSRMLRWLDTLCRHELDEHELVERSLACRS
jgi:Hemerythrin HHE cation binding domain